ncbi:MAG: preprotein translocase subunit SecA [Candidatus Buchananbacteria bacterium]|nr:preprotein translocase subunit SecA [Candidatus Buchananbacteria bacterium]
MATILDPIFNKVFGDPSQRFIKKHESLVGQINQLEKKFEAFSDEQLKNQTAEFKAQIADGKNIDELLPEAFAAVREASKRVLKMRHFDVQLIGGIVLHFGNIAEMKTGEGKTLVATLPLYLNALAGKGAHLITVNDYLSQRDCGWMAPVYHALGLTVGVIVHEAAFVYDPEFINENHKDERLRHLKPISRKDAYQADITYGTNNEFGFDYLRDNMAQNLNQMVQRDLHYAIVDEVDSILIDEARTPLIISAPDTESTEKYQQFARLVSQLKEGEDYNVDEKMRAATLTDAGVVRMEKMLGVDNIYTERGIVDVHHIEEALKAYALFRRDKDYVVKDGEIIIVDEFTGRLMEGRRYSEGLHQAIEAKEGVKIQRESRTMATITFQNYFRMFEKLAGMTGTAATEEEEFRKIYSLDVIVIPTNKPLARKDLADRIYKNEEGKFKAVVKEIKERQQKGQPVLVGTISIEKNEILSELLAREGIEVNLLNAKQHEKEAGVIAQAGRSGAVTVATNMAGRGVDIKLGGDPYDAEEEKKVKELGGLHVIGTERHESRRIDNQLRGRSGRQGDPGSTQFYVSMDDDLMRIFGSERMKKMMETLRVPDDMPIENRLISKSIETAQKKIEGFNFDTRKHVVEYDDVINRHRETIYKKRKDILVAENLKDIFLEMVRHEIESVVNFHTSDEDEKIWNVEEIYEVVNTIFSVPAGTRLKLEDIQQQADDEIKDRDSRTKIIGYLFKLAVEAYNDLENKFETAVGNLLPLQQILRGISLRSLDTLWVEHLEAIDSLRRGVGLRAYGQRDPLVEYKRESFILFKDLLAAIERQVVYSVYKIGAATEMAGGSIQMPSQEANLTFSAPAKTMSEGQSDIARVASQMTAGKTAQQQQVEARESTDPVNDATTHYNGQKVGRNEPCPCGSGKKFKNCHGK